MLASRGERRSRSLSVFLSRSERRHCRLSLRERNLQSARTARDREPIRLRCSWCLPPHLLIRVRTLSANRGETTFRQRDRPAHTRDSPKQTVQEGGISCSRPSIASASMEREVPSIDTHI